MAELVFIPVVGRVMLRVAVTVLVAVVEAGGACSEVLHSLHSLPRHHQHHQHHCHAPQPQHLLVNRYHICSDKINTHYYQ